MTVTNKRIFTCLEGLFLVAFAIMSAGCWSGDQAQPETTSISPNAGQQESVVTKLPTETRVSGSIAKIYQSADELLSDSAIVVVGVFDGKERIVSSNTTVVPFYPGWREMPFRVTHIIKGTPDAVVQVAQHVGFAPDGVRPVEDDTLFTTGSRYILFLTPQPGGGIYWLTGAIQGAFPVINGRVFSRNVVGDIPKEIGPTVDGKPLNQFIEDLQK